MTFVDQPERFLFPTDQITVLSEKRHGQMDLNIDQSAPRRFRASIENDHVATISEQPPSPSSCWLRSGLLLAEHVEKRLPGRFGIPALVSVLPITTSLARPGGAQHVVRIDRTADREHDRPPLRQVPAYGVVRYPEGRQTLRQQQEFRK